MSEQPSQPMIPAAALLSHFWTPLVAVTAAAGGRGSAQTAVSVHGASIVPERPRLTAGLWKTNLTHDLTLASGAFAVHLLGDDQDDLVFRLGLHSGHTTDKLSELPHDAGRTGTPLLRDCLAVFECRVIGRMDGGDHTVFLGEVVFSERRGAGAPLWWRDLRARAPQHLLDAWNARNAGHIEDSKRRMDPLD